MSLFSSEYSYFYMACDIEKPTLAQTNCVAFSAKSLPITRTWEHIKNHENLFHLYACHRVTISIRLYFNLSSRSRTSSPTHSMDTLPGPHDIKYRWCDVTVLWSVCGCMYGYEGCFLFSQHDSPKWRMKSIKMRREVNVSNVFMAPQAARVSTGIGTE